MAINSIDLCITPKQYAFISADADEVLFGGAAGGGKSYGQVVDALLYALKYNGSKQIIFRRTYRDLDKSIIRTMLSVYPRDLYKYNASSHTFTFCVNGSIIDCGYIANDSDVYQYQSAEYDVIRFDELTHFTEYQYVYMLSRLRGTNGYPKHVKSSTNPGGIGHQWVKARFIDCLTPDVPEQIGSTSRVFIPSLVTDNKFLMEQDPEYLERLKALPEKEQKALRYGIWDIFEGQYFAEFDRAIHVCKPFDIPKEWRRYRSFDYGLDCFACLWVAIDSSRDVYVYREISESNLPISAAAHRALEMTPPDESIYCTFAPPDMWMRVQDSGRSKAVIFAEHGLRITKSSNDREAGWLAIKELLKVNSDGHARLHIFETCRELIRCLPALIYDPKKPTDCATEPHDITHIPDALRGFAVQWTRPNDVADKNPKARWSEDMYEDYYSASKEGKEYLIKRYGNPF